MLVRPIVLPVVSAVTRAVTGLSRGGWSPLQLFAGGEAGAWYDPSDLLSMNTKSDLSGSVSAIGGPAGHIADKSGNGNNAAQATDTARPMIQARGNLLVYSEEFDNPAWIKLRVSVTQNATVAPDGATTADKLVEDTTTGAHAVYRTVTGLTASIPYTVSCYAKAAERGFVLVGMTDSATDYYCRVDLSAGEITQTIAGCSGVVTSIGNGWYRISVTRTIGATSVNPFVCINAASYLGNGTSGIFIWGAQLGLGSAPATYQRVTTATDYADVGLPRKVDYDGIDDKLTTTFPNLGADVTIARSVPGSGASILTGQTIGAGAWDDNTDHCGLVIVNRALTAGETALLTRYLDAKAGV